MSLLRRLFGSAMMGEALRERREILLESFDILKKEITMGAERVYRLSGRYLYAHNGKSVFEVDAEELRRVLVREGMEIGAGVIHSLFGMSFDSIFALRNQYDLRGGAAAMTPETVRETFRHTTLPHFKGFITVAGGQAGVHYWIDLDKREVRGGSKPLTYGAERRRGVDEKPRRKPWNGTRSCWRELRTNCGGRRAGDRLERRAPPGHPPRRSGAAERRTSIIRPLTEWEHECRSDYGHRTTLRSPFCPECGLSRLRGVERRALAHRRSPFSTGRRKEDA